MHDSESEVAQSCPTLSDPMDCSLPGSSVLGIFQTRVLEWGAIEFSLYKIHFGNLLSSTQKKVLYNLYNFSIKSVIAFKLKTV